MKGAIAISISLLLVEGLVRGEGCLDDARESSDKQLQGLPLLGGWSKVTGQDLQETIDALQGYAMSALSQWQEESNDYNAEFDVFQVNRGQIYSQVVAGINYCFGFTAKPKLCNANSENFPACKSQILACEAKAYVVPWLAEGAPTAKITSVFCDEKSNA